MILSFTGNLSWRKLPPQIHKTMKLLCFLMTAAFLQVYATGSAQVTLSLKGAPLEKALHEIERQTGYGFLYTKKMMREAPDVTIDVKNVSVSQALQECFRGQPLEYSIDKNTIVITRKVLTSEWQLPGFVLPPPIDVHGRVVNEKGEPVAGASIKVKGSDKGISTDANGEFVLTGIDENATLIISGVNIETFEVKVNGKTDLGVLKGKLKISENEEIEIVSTGYQQLPKERATGSFVFIDNKLLNRRVSTNILDRLEGVTSGLIFNPGSINAGTRLRNEQTGITIRGRSTIDEKVSADPLIVLDNFPYEGNINNINPNEVESITILKDAAAASIWGTRAGNGVIVITTKKGKYNQKLKVELNSNLTFGEKPNLFYSKNYLPSTGFIEVETYLFNKGYFDRYINDTYSHSMISPVVDILDKKRSGLLSEADAQTKLDALKQNDVRKDFEKYVYRPSLSQQYSVNMKGGTQKAAYSLTAGYDKNLESLIRNKYERFSINSINTFSPAKNLELTADIRYSNSVATINTNGAAYGNVSVGGAYGRVFPYARLADDEGNPMAIVKNFRSDYINSTANLGFLDWTYKPLEDIRYADYTSAIADLILRGMIKYNFTPALNAVVQYQYQSQSTQNRNYQSLQSYSTRNLINTFFNPAETSGTLRYPVPKGAILDLYNGTLTSGNFRTQLNYNKLFNNVHEITALGGVELREISMIGTPRTSYGYDEETGASVSNLNYQAYYPINPVGSSPIPAPSGNVSGSTNRYISYYGNIAYTFHSRYTVSASARKDGANIFGVKTNDKITPLWSGGVSWDISKEKFYRFSALPYLKLRASYGYNGNVYNASAYLTAQYRTSELTGQPYSTIISPPNPLLRWEKVRNINIGIDFRSKSSVFSGSIEWYQKDGTDLINKTPLAPSTGFSSFKGNAAALRTKGLDMTLNTINVRRAVEWNTSVLVSYQSDRVVHIDKAFDTKTLVGSSVLGTPEFAGLLPVEGKPLFGVYSYKWGGLDKEGNPQGYLEDKLSTNYTEILSKSSFNNLVFHGSSRPVWFGSVRNTITWKGLSISANITFKLKYFFRRSSVNLNYWQNISGIYTNEDYDKRWQKSGDENLTNVPSLVYNNPNRNNFYQGSSVLIEKGDHIRLQDITLQYTLDKQVFKNLPFEQVQLYMYANNLGILWRANNQGIDPDFIDNGTQMAIPNPKTISLGLRLIF